jgi:hypothetical protein
LAKVRCPKELIQLARTGKSGEEDQNHDNYNKCINRCGGELYNSEQVSSRPLILIARKERILKKNFVA